MNSLQYLNSSFRRPAPPSPPPHHCWVKSLDVQSGTSSKNSSLIQNHWPLRLPRKTVSHGIQYTVRLAGAKTNGAGFSLGRGPAFPRWWPNEASNKLGSGFRPQHPGKPGQGFCHLGWATEQPRDFTLALWAREILNLIILLATKMW